jgi:hypothetical protein
MKSADIEAKKKLFLETLAETGRMSDARKASGLSPYLVSKIRETDVNFEQAIQASQELSIENRFENLDKALEIYPNPQQAKVFSDNLKWTLAKLRPERFGDRLDLKTTLTVDLTDRFAKALERLTVDRLRPSRDLTDVSEAQIIDITPQSDDTASDIETDSMALPCLPADAGTLTGQDERAVSGDRGVAGAAPQTWARPGALPPLQPDRDGEKSKDYAPLQDPQPDGH